MKTVKLQDILGVKKKVLNPIDEIDIIVSAISKEIIEKLVEYSGLSKGEIVNLLPVSPRTIDRLTDEVITNTALAEHILYLAKVTTEGLEVFESSQEFAEWLKKPHLKLSNLEPYELLTTVSGCNVVIDMLGQIKYGIFS